MSHGQGSSQGSPPDLVISNDTQQSPANGRSLPSRDVTDANFDEAYVSFIMYCNPSVAIDTDTLELKKVFRSPPKSDGKTFNTFTLFELIRKLELKELKTWAQLAIELGVEPPALEKGQSAQKIQQYAVRLKRWMHAMHVDAFFEYLLNKPHIYWTRIPNPNEPAPEHGRDGVVPEEDLALRALLPETRPKRGRRKADDRDEGSEISRSPAQRPRFHSPAISEDFSLAKTSNTENDTPATAHPSTHAPFQPNTSSSTEHFDSFASSQSFNGPNSFSHNANRWSSQGEGSFSAYPQSAFPHSAYPEPSYPMSAMLPRGVNPFSFDDEPRSAITPSKSRPRRRHGPAVSSAWPSNSASNTGKLRGRPPSNRNVSDGPFSTFPANPATTPAPIINLRDPTPTATPVVDRSQDGETAFPFPPNLQESQRARVGRGNQLHLQVPERVGGPVRLATPPPAQQTNVAPRSSPRTSDFAQTYSNNPLPNSYEAYEQADLQRSRSDPPPATSQHQQPPQLPKQSPLFWDKPVAPPPPPAPEPEDRTNVPAIELACAQLLLSAQWFSTTGAPTGRCTMKEAMLLSKQLIIDMSDEAPTKELFLLSLCALTGANALLTGVKMRRFGRDIRTVRFGVKWTLRFGTLEGTYVKTVEISEKALGPEGERQLGDEWPDTTNESWDGWEEGSAVDMGGPRGGNGNGGNSGVGGENGSKAGAGPGTAAGGLRIMEERVVEVTNALAEKDKKIRELKADIMEVLLRHGQSSGL